MAKQEKETEDLINLSANQHEISPRRPPSGALNFNWFANPFSHTDDESANTMELQGATIDESCDELLYDRMTEALGVLTPKAEEMEAEPVEVTEKSVAAAANKEPISQVNKEQDDPVKKDSINIKKSFEKVIKHVTQGYIEVDNDDKESVNELMDFEASHHAKQAVKKIEEQTETEGYSLIGAFETENQSCVYTEVERVGNFKVREGLNDVDSSVLDRQGKITIHMEKDSYNDKYSPPFSHSMQKSVISKSDEASVKSPQRKLFVRKTDSDRKDLLDNEEITDEVPDHFVDDSEVTLPSDECGLSDSNLSDDNMDKLVNESISSADKYREGEDQSSLTHVEDDTKNEHEHALNVSYDSHNETRSFNENVDTDMKKEAKSAQEVYQVKVEIEDIANQNSDNAVKFRFADDNDELDEELTDNAPFSKYVNMIDLSNSSFNPFSEPGNTHTQQKLHNHHHQSVNDDMLRRTMKKGKEDQVKLMVRHAGWAMDDDIRQRLWMMQCKYRHKASSHDIFSEFALDLFPKGEYHDIRLPSFVDLNQTNHYYLNTNGIMNVKKVLSVLEHASPDIVYSPLLFSYVALFLHYMEPSDCYNCIDSLLHESVAGYIAQTKVSYEASKLVIRDLAKKYAKSGFVLLVRNCSSIDSVFDSWNAWIFQDLPFSYLIRVIDCYLHEGVKVMYRVILAILILFSKNQPKHSRLSRRQDSMGPNVLNSLRQFCREPPVSIDKLLKVGFGIRGLTRKEINRLQLKHEMYINSTKHLHTDQNAGNNTAKMNMSRSFSGPIVLQNIGSNMLSSDMLFAIWTWLPQRYAVCQPELLYTSEEHGTSLVTLYQRVENYQPTVIVIKSTNDEIFGAFCSAHWRERRETSSTMLSYFGTGETFIFALQPKRQKYEWVGLTEEVIPNTAHMFQAGDRKCLIIGGGHGEAIYLDENLLHCRTEKCDTFNNEPLCAHEDFICKVVEVYGFQ